MSITKDHRKGDEMDVTEELCRLLDEQGLEWREHEAPAAECIAFFDGNGWHDCWESVGGEVNVTFSMTPEQAIAATLGSCNCSNDCTNGEQTGACHADETDAWECVCDQMGRYGKRVTIHVMECSKCGRTYEHVNGNYEFCPNCGRRIVDPTTNDVDAEVGA